MTGRTRNTNNGKFERSIETAERDARAASLKAQNRTYAQIAEELGMAVSSVHAAVQRALAAVPVEAASHLRAIECARLDAIIDRLWGIVHEDQHPVVARISALAQIRATGESKRRLLGLDAPARQTVTVISEDLVDAELRRLEQQLADAQTT